jgi:flagellar biosynthesis/type III secretory pathway M-ring protein FliF/YscJ
LVVVNTQFQLPAIAAPVEPETPMAPWMRELIQWGALALLLLILVFGVVRPVLNAAKAQTPALVTPEGISFGTELPSESAALPSPAEVVPVGERLRLRAIESTRSNPDRAVQIIRTWLHQED